jgi:hypothetical protein
MQECSPGNQYLASQLTNFIEALAKESIPNFLKNEVLEHIDFISKQLAGKEPPKKEVLKSVLNSIPMLITSSESLTNIWNTISEQIYEFIQ